MEESIQQPATGGEGSTRHIAVYGKHEYILHNVETLLQRAGYSTQGYVRLEEVMDHIRLNKVDGLLIGGGVDPHDRLRLQDFISKESLGVRVIEHFGGPATILSEVQSAFR